MPTAFVTGATGFTGREVVRLLVERGVFTVAHVRLDSPRGPHWSDQFTGMGAAVDRTPWDDDAMAETLRALAPDVVFCLLGITRAGARRERKRTGRLATYDNVDYGLTALLARATTRLEKAPRFVYLSATGTGPGAATAYGRARHRAEEAVRDSGLPWVIARPGLISGPGRDDDRPAERAADAVLRTLAQAAERFGASGFARRFAPIDNTTLARALVEAGLAPEGAGRVLEAVDLWGTESEGK